MVLLVHLLGLYDIVILVIMAWNLDLLTLSSVDEVAVDHALARILVYVFGRLGMRLVSLG